MPGLVPVLVHALLLAAAIGLWLYASGTLYRAGFSHLWPQTKPSVALRIPGMLYQSAALEDGIHTIVMFDGSRRFAAQFQRATHLGNAGYHRAATSRLLGVTLAVLRRPDSSTDSIVSPYAAVVLPYWLPIAVAATFLFWTCRPGRIK